MIIKNVNGMIGNIMDDNKNSLRRLFDLSLASIFIVAPLVIISLKLEKAGQLWPAFVLMVTSNILVIIYLIGMHLIFNAMKNRAVDKENE